MEGGRLLVVDDDPALLEALSRALRLRMPELTVDSVVSGPEALGRLGQAEYDAVVTDIKMPGMDGLTLLSEIRNGFPDVPTLLITGHGQHDLAVQALRGGAFDFIQKPIDRDYFIASLTRALRVRQLGRQVEAQKRALEQHAASLEQTVEERTRELYEANQAKDRFLAVLGHELRNPLASIHGAVELMSHCNDRDPARDEAQQIVERQVRHMARLLDDLLDISRIRQDRIVLRKQPLNVADFVTSAVQATQPAVEEHRHRLTVSLPDEVLTVEGDPTRLEQVLINLISNAVKYTEPGGRISLEGERHGRMAVLRVRDDGIGISAEMLERIFEPFAQGDHPLGWEQGGLGIGLTLVRKLVALHGGTVQAESEGAGRGSTFIVRIPLAEASSSVEDLPPEPLRVPSPEVPRSRILVVEDDPDLARLTEKLLEKCGSHTVQVVRNGPAAIEAVGVCRPEIALIDLGLPGMSGYELARHLREQPNGNPLALIALTGYGQKEDQHRSREAGFDEHLVKPVSVETLQQVLARYAQAPQRS